MNIHKVTVNWRTSAHTYRSTCPSLDVVMHRNHKTV